MDCTGKLQRQLGERNYISLSMSRRHGGFLLEVSAHAESLPIVISCTATKPVVFALVLSQ